MPLNELRTQQTKEWEMRNEKWLWLPKKNTINQLCYKLMIFGIVDDMLLAIVDYIERIYWDGGGVWLKMKIRKVDFILFFTCACNWIRSKLCIGWCKVISMSIFGARKYLCVIIDLGRTDATATTATKLLLFWLNRINDRENCRNALRWFLSAKCMVPELYEFCGTRECYRTIWIKTNTLSFTHSFKLVTQIDSRV